MPALSQHVSSEVTKMLYLGHSGTGKTGSLASLAEAGYNLRIMDFDNGLDILAKLLQDNPDALARVQFKTFTDKMKMVGNSIQAISTIFPNAMAFLNSWTEGEVKLGSVSTWGPQDVLVIDSLTFMSNAALNHVLAVNGRAGQNPTQPNWGEAQRLVEGVLQLLYSTEVKCNVIVISHIASVADENEQGAISQGFPMSLGKKLPPKIPRYFNTMVEAFTQGVGAQAKRKIRTRSRAGLELKVANPKIEGEYPLETGLASIFKVMRGK